MRTFCCGKGLYDSRTTDYDTATFEALLQLLQNPPQLSKTEAYWAIFSSEHGPSARKRSQQLETGQFCALVLDMDEGHVSKESLIQILQNRIGHYNYILYTTASATPDALRWRVLIPTQDLMGGLQYQWMQRALMDTLSDDLIPDRRLEHASQIIFLPVASVAYDYAIVEGPPIPIRQGPIFDLARSLMITERPRSDSLKKSRNGARGWFNDRYPTHQLLVLANYQTLDEVNWRSPYQTSGSYATRLHDDGSWFSLSQSDAMNGLGAPAQGGRIGDGFDIFAHYLCEKGLAQQAVNAIGYGWELGDPLPTTYHLDVGRRLFQGYMQAKKAAQEQFLKDNPLPPRSKVRLKYTTMPEPTGNLRMVASWIYSSVMNDPQRDLAVIFAWLLAASFAGRKDSLKENPPVLNIRVMAINGTGKDSCRRAHEMILQGLRERALARQDLIFMKDLSTLDGLKPTYGAKRMALDCLKTLSSLSVSSEAGIQNKSLAGDVESVRAANMQNISQAAYSRKTFKGLAEVLPDSYGSNISVLEEATKETIIGTQQVATGETARKLSFQIDASDVGQSVLHDSVQVPDQILDLFEKLALEALRGENPAQTSDKQPAVAMHPVLQDQKRIFEFSPQAAAKIEALLDDRTSYRRQNKDNVPSLAWAQRTRYEQLILRAALIHARTRNLVATVIELEDLNAAQALVDESRRSEQVNATDFENPMERVLSAMHEYAIDQLSQKEPSATYRIKNKLDFEISFMQRRMNSQMFTAAGNNRKYFKLAAELVDSQKRGFHTTGDIMRNAAEYGSQKGIWEFHTPGKARWYVDNVVELDPDD